MLWGKKAVAPQRQNSLYGEGKYKDTKGSLKKEPTQSSVSNIVTDTRGPINEIVCIIASGDTV